MEVWHVDGAGLVVAVVDVDSDERWRDACGEGPLFDAQVVDAADVFRWIGVLFDSFGF